MIMKLKEPRYWQRTSKKWIKACQEENAKRKQAFKQRCPIVDCNQKSAKILCRDTCIKGNKWLLKSFQIVL